MKVSEWLRERDSHSMYKSEEMKEKFKTATGLDAPAWGEQKITKRFIKDVESTGGWCNFELGTEITSGYQMASSCARKFADYSSDKLGRGFLFRDCIEALDRAGK